MNGRTESSPQQSLGGQLWLDLVNTQIMLDGLLVDLLTTPSEFMAWCRNAGIEPQGLTQTEAVGLLAASHQLRQQLRGMAEDIEAGKEPSAAVTGLNELLVSQIRCMQLVPSGKGYVKTILDLSKDPRRWLAPVAESAADFLVSGDYARLRRCANPDCVIHFYDRTKNRTRRFCSPALCGNRFKVAAFFRRKREAKARAGKQAVKL